MSIHDWTRVEAGIFHDFHVAWLPELRKVLNNGVLPEGYYALAEQHAGRAIADVLTLHASPESSDPLPPPTSGGVVLAEAPPGVRRKQSVEAALGIHALVIDLFPPGAHDPRGIHEWILNEIDENAGPYDLPDAEPLTLARYAAGPVVDIYLEHLALGSTLPEMPLFLHADRYVNIPLEATYEAAFAGMPHFWRDVLTLPAPPSDRA